jgi:putative transposase
MYLYRAIDKEGSTVDFLLTKRRNKRVAHLFLLKAVHNNDRLEIININRSGANKEAIRTYNKRAWSKI